MNEKIEDYYIVQSMTIDEHKKKYEAKIYCNILKNVQDAIMDGRGTILLENLYLDDNRFYININRFCASPAPILSLIKLSRGFHIYVSDYDLEYWKQKNGVSFGNIINKDEFNDLSSKSDFDNKSLVVLSFDNYTHKSVDIFRKEIAKSTLKAPNELSCAIGASYFTNQKGMGGWDVLYGCVDLNNNINYKNYKNDVLKILNKCSSDLSKLY